MLFINSIKYIFKMALLPEKTTKELLNDPRRMEIGIVAWLFLSLLYGVAAFIGGLNGLGAVTQPYLPIPAKIYYLWMGPFTPIIYLMIFILLAGMIQLGSKLLKGQGTFEDTFICVVLAYWLPTFITMWLFEMPVLVFFPNLRRSDLGGLGYIPEWLDSFRQIVGIIWAIVLITISTNIVQRLTLVKIGIITIIGMIPVLAIILVFIR